MEVINKLYYSVTQTVSQLSLVLPGNPVIREYDINRHIGSAGKGCVWKIFSGFKKSTKEESSIFVLEKKLFERYSKEDREEIYSVIKHGVVQLTKIRHPQILTVQHALEESRESFAFATEPVHTTLANILGETTNVPSAITSQLETINLSETEIKYGLIQIMEAVKFIHDEAQLVHRNICPHNVILNIHGSWKIFGFDYCVSSLQIFRCSFNPNQNIFTVPSLEYTAPECVLDRIISIRSDYFSFGILICAIYTKKCFPFMIMEKDYDVFRKFTADLRLPKHPKLPFLPSEIQHFVRLLLSAAPENRPDLIQFSKVPYFEDAGVKTLTFLRTIIQRNNQEKAKFYKDLPQIIRLLSARINLHMVLPCIVKEFVCITMIPFVLPSVLLIAENCTQAEFEKHVLTHLKPIMNLQEPTEILLIFMNNIELLIKLIPTSEMEAIILPIAYRALESSSQQIQELCLRVIPSFGHLVNFQCMKNSLLPRIKNVCLHSCNVSVRVNCLLCIGKLLPYLNKWTVLDDVLRFLPTIASRESAVIMAIVGIYKITSNHESLGIPKEFIARNVLPFLWPLSIETSLTIQQHQNVMILIKDLSESVESEHSRKLKQLNTDDRNSLQINSVSSEYQFQIENQLQIENQYQIDGLRSQINIVTSDANASCASSISQIVPQITALQPQHYLHANAGSFNSNASFSSPFLLQPIKIPDPNVKDQSNNILTNEDILEFLK
ncbi:SCY1-like protein 2 [Sabethes cyaneus]|uniref:SCY1-like protein 2 n=1 Tax=Sabethes cyaneus TaxID=53552 RepID=UPI00221E2947|nr:SCY1-like protein 2 [Sabethes cyaneus]